MNKFHDNTSIKVSTVDLMVKNIENSINFYKDYIGLTILERQENYASLSANGKDPLLNLHTGKNITTKKQNIGLYHFAILLPSPESLAHIFLNLAERNYVFTGFSDHGVSMAIYLNDPEGNGIELYCDRPQDEWPTKNGQIDMYTEPLNYENLLIIAPKEKFEKIDKNSILGHLHLHVSNIEEAENFFINILTFKLVLKYGEAARFVSTNGYHHHIGFNNWIGQAPARENSAVGLIGYTISLPKDKLQIILENLNKQNIKIDYDINNNPQIIDPTNSLITFKVS